MSVREKLAVVQIFGDTEIPNVPGLSQDFWCQPKPKCICHSGEYLGLGYPTTWFESKFIDDKFISTFCAIKTVMQIMESPSWSE